MIETAVQTLLLNASSLIPLLGGRVYFGLRPLNERNKCVVITRITTARELTFKGPAGYSTGTLQLDCFGPTYPDAKQLGDAIRKALDGYTGTVADADATDVGYLSVTDERDMPVVPNEGRGTPLVYGVSVEVNYLVKE